MNWDALGAVAELLGAAGVIASLLYLAAQVRHSAAATRAAAGQAATTNFRQVIAPVSSDPHLAKLFGDMFEDFDGLEGVGRQQALHLMFQCWKAAESVHYQHSKGMLDSRTWASWERIFIHYVNTPGFRAYWRVRRELYTEGFQAWTDANLHHEEGIIATRI